MSQEVHLPPPAGQGIDLPDYDPPEEYVQAARAWASYCQAFGAEATKDGHHLLDQPLVVVLLAALCEPARYAPVFTGDLIADVLGGLRAFVEHLDDDAYHGNGAGAFLTGYQIEGFARRLDAILTLRTYERAYEKAGKA